MCGFIVARKSDLVTDLCFKKSLEKIQHRGPDDSKILESNGLLYGFNRLSIQDLSEFGSQPMRDSDGNILCFNGEIYNFQSLRQDLKKDGEEFLSNSDTEVLLKLLSIYGLSKTLEKIDGMYAFVYLDASSNKIFACRDSFGMKPLFYYSNGNEVIFSSEIKSIVPLIPSSTINIVKTFNPLFFNGLSSGNGTIFNEIKSLKPGFILEYCLNTRSLKNKQFFDLSSLVNANDYLENAKLSQNELSEKVEGALQRSVKSHMVSDAKTGILYSAGLDSSLVAAIASKINSTPLDLFKYQSTDLDDSALANSFASRFNSRLHVTKGQEENLIFRLPHLIYTYEMLNKADGAPLSMVCANAHKENYKVLLTGDAADELFGGYGNFDAFRLNQYIKTKFDFPWLINFFNKVFPGARNISIESMHHLISPFDDRFIQSYLDFTLFEGKRNREWSDCVDAYSFLKDDYEVKTNAFLLDEVKSRLERFLIRSDRIGMANSIELRTPFLSKEIVGLALNIPIAKRSIFAPSVKRRRLFNSKYQLKTLANRLNINAGIVSRAKVGTPTGSVDDANLLTIGSRIKFSNIGNSFDINSADISRFLSNIKFTPMALRANWSFVSMEILIRMLKYNETPELIENEFRELLS
tara:strand:+ start:804 stop:2714 length:1911 start_codon:yes stop_codon:yes gene_type:complete